MIETILLPAIRLARDIPRTSSRRSQKSQRHPAPGYWLDQRGLQRNDGRSIAMSARRLDRGLGASRGGARLRRAFTS